jgi:flagellar motor switch protein FliM
VSETDEQEPERQPDTRTGSDARDPAHVEIDDDAQAAADAERTDDPQTAADTEAATGPRAAGDAEDALAVDTSSDSDSFPLPPEDGDDPLIVRRGRTRRVRTVDFSQPNKFTAELRRRVVRVLGPFCEAFAIRLSTELRTPVELAVVDSSQLTWSAAKAQQPAGAIAVALDTQPLGRPESAQQMLLSIDVPLILRALECLLGGSASQAPADRRLSEIDWALTRRLLEAMTAQLAPAWRDLGGLQLSLGEIDLEGDAGVLVPLGEPTFAVTLECRIDGLPAQMSLLVPWSSIGSVAEDIVGAGPRPEDASPQEGQAMQRGLAGARVQLRAEVGSARMPVQQMLALNPGTLLALEERAEDGVHLFAEGVPLGRASPGLRGTHRAIKLTAPIEPGRASAIASTTGLRQARQAGRSALVAEDEPLDSDVEDERSADGHGLDEDALGTSDGLARMLGVSVRVWAELGRTALPLGNALELPPGTVLELEQGAEDPIELFVNGMRFAHGTLQVTAEGEWAVQIDALV